MVSILLPLNTLLSLKIVTSITAGTWIQEIKLIHVEMRWCGDQRVKASYRSIRSCILSYTFTISITAHFSILNPTKWRLFKCTAVVIKKRSTQCLSWPLINLPHSF